MIHKAETTPSDWNWTYIKVQKSTFLVQQVHWTQIVIIPLSRLHPATNGDHRAFWKQKYYLFKRVRCLLSPKASDFWLPGQGCCFLFFPLCQILLDDKVPSLNRSSFENYYYSFFLLCLLKCFAWFKQLKGNLQSWQNFPKWFLMEMEVLTGTIPSPSTLLLLPSPPSPLPPPSPSLH